MPQRFPLSFLLALCLIPTSLFANSTTYTAHDTLHITPDKNPRAQRVIDACAYKPATFKVTVTPTPGKSYDFLVTFPSAKPTGSAIRDTVYLRWYAPHDAQHHCLTAPPVLLVHSLQPQLIVARMIARQLADDGFNAFVIEMPGYAHRIADPGLPTGVEALLHATQAVADVRRARDAILALPHIKGQTVTLEGTSLGGFVAATAASLDHAFKPVLLLLAGANGYDVLKHGQKDAALLARAMHDLGYRGQRLRHLLDKADPLFVAHRLNPKQTWLFSARYDTVVPRADSDALARAILLPASHRFWLSTNHYTTLFVLPGVVHQMVRIIRGKTLHPNNPTIAATQPAASP